MLNWRLCIWSKILLQAFVIYFSFDEIFKHGLPQDKIAIKDAKTAETVHLIIGNTRRIILHTSTVTCLDRDSSPDTRFMYRASYVSQL